MNYIDFLNSKDVARHMREANPKTMSSASTGALPGDEHKMFIGSLVNSIDRANSTHQATEGPNGGNKGREKTAMYACI